jgi:ankyrin repeat protein
MGGTQWTAGCSLGSSTGLSATAVDSKKTKFNDEIQDVDLTERVGSAAFESALDDAVAMYRIERYHDARLGLLNIINKLHDLPPLLLGNYDFFGIAYMHAVAVYHSTDYVNARHVLMDFVLEQAMTRSQKLCLAHASSLLAFVSIELREFQAARVACAKAVQLCYSIDSKHEKILDDYIALSARVETLLGNHARAQALINKVDPARQGLLTRFCARYAHKQGLRTKERCVIAQNEADLFANTRLCEHTGKVTILVTQERFWGGRSFMRRLGRPSKSQSCGITGLHFAALFGDAEEASALIDNGANVDAEAYVARFRHIQWTTEHSLTPLACALLLRHGNLVRLLVSRGAKFTRSDGTSVVFAIMNEAFVCDDSHSFREILEILQLLGWDINSPSGSKGRTLLHNAARSSKKTHARTLISRGASVMVEDQRGNIPLNAAITRWRHGSRVPAMISTLLQHQKLEQLMRRNHRGMTPLHTVIYGNHPLEQIALFLLKAGADPYAVDELGRIPYNWLQGRWDWTGVSKFLTQNRSEMPLAACLDSQEMKVDLI